MASAALAPQLASSFNDVAMVLRSGLSRLELLASGLVPEPAQIEPDTLCEMRNLSEDCHNLIEAMASIHGALRSALNPDQHPADDVIDVSAAEVG